MHLGLLACLLDGHRAPDLPSRFGRGTLAPARVCIDALKPSSTASVVGRPTLADRLRHHRARGIDRMSEVEETRTERTETRSTTPPPSTPPPTPKPDDDDDENDGTSDDDA